MSLDLSIEELEKLASLDEPIKKSSKKDQPKVVNFIRKYDIKSGNIKTLASIIYYKYRVIDRGSLGRETFFHTFAKYFERVKSNGRRYYLLNDSFDISCEMEERALRYTKLRKKVKDEQVEEEN